MKTPVAQSLSRHKLVASASIGVALVVLGIKYIAYHLTGSVALFSDAMESIVNVLTAVAALIAIRIAAQPHQTVVRADAPEEQHGSERPQDERRCHRAPVYG